MEEMQKLQKFQNYLFLNLHNLLERACNDRKLYIYIESAPRNVSRNNTFSYCKIT